MHVISVTPVSRGVVRPFLLTVTTVALIVEAAHRFDLVHRYEDWLLLLLAVPLALVTLTRTWRWRSHKIHVTNARIVIEGGVLARRHTSIELGDVVATRVDQRVHERLTRRGLVVLETAAGPVAVGLVHHPGALCRLIDAERVSEQPTFPLDTVFTYDGTDAAPLAAPPDQWPRRRYE